MKRLQFGTAIAVLFFTVSGSLGLGPHECIIIANRRTMESVELANYYAHLRQIPPINIVHLDLPDKALDADATFTPDEFRQYIFDPVNKIIRDRNIASHILVWLYSLDFPTRIETTPPMSLTGMTFVRGNPPSPELIEGGNWLSPLFIGPDRADGPKSPPAGLEEFTIRLTTNMPTPSMMLGWSGSRGMSVQQIKDQLRVAASSDGAHPSASVYFELNQDVRSEMRQWQFQPVIKELSGLGVAGIAVSNIPAERVDLMGIMGGRAVFNAGSYSSLQPGAYAEHLTSFAAIFHEPSQTKLTEWLKLGAAGSSGTVVEPGSSTKPVIIWTKFPTARLYSHYASGCTLIESLYLSTRSPLQLLMVGDALCSPWAKPPGITLISMADDEAKPIIGKGEFLASSWGGFGQRSPTTIFLLDGRPVNQPGNKPEFNIDTGRLYDGHHELRVVAYANDSIRHQGFNQKTFSTRNRLRGATLSGYEPNQQVDLYKEISFNITADGNPKEAAIIAQERVVARAPYSSNVTLRFSPSLVGSGPVSFQGVVVYDDNEPVRSAPLLLNIEPLNQPPVISSFIVQTNASQELVYGIAANDPDGDAVTTLWYADVLKGDSDGIIAPAKNAETYLATNGTVKLAARSKTVFATFDLEQPHLISEVSTTVRFSDHRPASPDHMAGVVFNYLNENNFMYWGFQGHLSAWILVRMKDGEEKIILSRGVGLDPLKKYTLSVAAIGSQKIGLLINGDLLAITDASFSAGRIGVRSGTIASVVDELLVSPASSYRSYFSEQQDGIAIRKDHDDDARVLHGAARDIHRFTTIRRPE